MKTLIIVALAFLFACGTQAGAHPELRPARPSPFSPFAAPVSMGDMLCAGIPVEWCRSYRNTFAPGWAVGGLWVNGKPHPIFPVGGHLPLNKLLYGQTTPLVLPGCARPGFDDKGQMYCQFTIVAEMYPVVVNPYLLSDPRTAELAASYVPDNTVRRCLTQTVHIYPTTSAVWQPPISHTVANSGRGEACSSNFYPADFAAAVNKS